MTLTGDVSCKNSVLVCVMNKDLIKATRPIVHRAQQCRREAGHITERIVTYPLETAV